MTKEEEYQPSPEYLLLVRKVREWMDLNKVKVFLFDLDDTLFQTHRLFDEKYTEGLVHITTGFATDHQQEVNQGLLKIIDDAYVKVGIEPDVFWRYISDQAQLRYPEITPEAAESFRLKMMEVYTTKPELYPGAIDTLKILTLAGARIGFVTHANGDWTTIKITGIENYFEHGRITPLDRPKTAQIWNLAVSDFNIHPEYAVAIGDNLKGDIQAAREVGIQTLFWIDGKTWNVYKAGTKPAGIRTICEIGNLTQALMRELTIATLTQRSDHQAKQIYP